MSNTDSESERHGGVVNRIRESPADIIVAEGQGDDVFIKADDQVMLLSRTEASIVESELSSVLAGERK